VTQANESSGDDMPGLGRIQPMRLDPKQLFRDADRLLDFDVLSFWQWSWSDLVSNATRGVLAEYLVARACRGRAFGCCLPGALAEPSLRPIGLKT
jgi:hypothetical protein